MADVAVGFYSLGNHDKANMLGVVVYVLAFVKLLTKSILIKAVNSSLLVIDIVLDAKEVLLDVAMPYA